MEGFWVMDTCGCAVTHADLSYQQKYGKFIHCDKCDYSTWVSNSTFVGKCGHCEGLLDGR